MSTANKSKNPYDIEDDDDDLEQKITIDQKIKEDPLIDKINVNNNDPRVINKISENETNTPLVNEQGSFCKNCVACSIF